MTRTSPILFRSRFSLSLNFLLSPVLATGPFPRALFLLPSRLCFFFVRRFFFHRPRSDNSIAVTAVPKRACRRGSCHGQPWTWSWQVLSHTEKLEDAARRACAERARIPWGWGFGLGWVGLGVGVGSAEYRLRGFVQRETSRLHSRWRRWRRKTRGEGDR